MPYRLQLSQLKIMNCFQIRLQLLYDTIGFYFIMYAFSILIIDNTDIPMGLLSLILTAAFILYSVTFLIKNKSSHSISSYVSWLKFWQQAWSNVL